MVFLIEVPDVAFLDGWEHGGDLGDRLLLGCEGSLKLADLSDDVGVAAHGKVGSHTGQKKRLNENDSENF